mmetsp:Transcript_28265/g.76576  ORF Transcript_28265/g.76576 Transcript_28265/m.76576 type:complete len:201 (+) Transcript_28265:1146-1748(+)
MLAIHCTNFLEIVQIGHFSLALQHPIFQGLHRIFFLALLLLERHFLFASFLVLVHLIVPSSPRLHLVIRVFRIRQEGYRPRTVRAFDVEPKALDSQIPALGTPHGLFFGIEFAPPVQKRVAGATLHRKGKHHPDRDRSIFFREGLPARDQGRVEIGRYVLVEDLPFTHFDRLSVAFACFVTGTFVWFVASMWRCGLGRVI